MTEEEVRDEVDAQPEPKRERRPRKPRGPRGQKKYKGRLCKNVSVYPTDETLRVLGGNSTNACQPAVNCWAHLLRQETLGLERILEPDDWRILALSHQEGQLKITPDFDNPGVILAEMVEACSRRLGVSEAEQEAHTKLARYLREQGYVRVWAILFALEYRVAQSIPVEGDAWWELGNRALPE